MKNVILELLSPKGQLSSLRALSFISLALGGYIGVTGIHSDKNLADVAILVSVFVGAAFGGKVMQKREESKKNNE